MKFRKILWLVCASLLLVCTASRAQTVTSQITGTYPNFTWAEWDQSQSQNMNVNIDPDPAGIFGCWTGLLLNQYPGYSRTGPWFATWNMTVPTAGFYMLEMEYAMNARSLRPGNISVNGTLAASNVIGSATGGWCPANLAWSPMTIVPLNAGVNAIRWERVGGLYTPHFHGVRLKKVDPPSISKVFSPNAALVGDGAGTVTSTVTITVANAGNATGYTGSLTTVAAFSDVLPAGVVVAGSPNASTTCNATATPAPLAVVAGASGVTLPTNSTLPAGSCTITFDVNVPTASAAVFTNALVAGALQTNGGNSVAPAQAIFTVSAVPTAATPVPTLNQWMLVAMAAMLAFAAAGLGVRRRKP